MTEKETDPAALIAKSAEVDTYDFAHESDEDDYVSMVLYRAPDGRHFRHIIASGMSSSWAGASDIIERVDDKLSWFDSDAGDGGTLDD
jgi:hypothetical protein